MMLAPELVEFAETPGPFTRVVSDGDSSLHIDERICIVQFRTMAFVTAPQAEEGGVESLLEHVRSLVPPEKHTTWFIGPSARPATIVEELRSLGLHDPFSGSSTAFAMALDTEPPPGPADADVGEVETYAEYEAATELQWDAFAFPPELREKQRAGLQQAFAAYNRHRGDSIVRFLAKLDGKVAASAEALPTDRGLFLIGGATAPWARGRGLYRALIRARWDYAASRKTPALAVHADPKTSYPILRRAGFETVCEIACLEM